MCMEDTSYILHGLIWIGITLSIAGAGHLKNKQLQINSIGNQVIKLKLDSYSGACHAEHKDISFVIIFQILME